MSIFFLNQKTSSQYAFKINLMFIKILFIYRKKNHSKVKRIVDKISVYII